MALLLLAVLVRCTLARTLPSSASLIADYNVTQPGQHRLVTGQSRSVGHYVSESAPRAIGGHLFVFPPSLKLDRTGGSSIVNFNRKRRISDIAQSPVLTEPPLPVPVPAPEEDSQEVAPWHQIGDRGPWLALLPEGDSEGASDHLTGAIDAGASGVILVDWKQDELFSVVSPGPHLPQQSDRGAVIVVIGPRYADQLLALVAANASLRLEIFPTRIDPESSGSPEVFQFLTVIVLALVTVVWTLIYCALRVRLARLTQRNNKKHLSATAQRLLQLVPARVLADGDLVDPEDSGNGSTRHCCIVCLDSYSAGDQVFVLPCRHFFHRDCIEPWIAQHAKCPVCKMNLLTYYQLASNSEESLVEVGSSHVRLPSSQPVVMVTSTDGDQVSELRSPRSAVRSVSTMCFYRRPSCTSLAPRRLMARPNGGALAPSADNGASRRRSAPARPSTFLPAC